MSRVEHGGPVTRLLAALLAIVDRPRNALAALVAIRQDEDWQGWVRRRLPIGSQCKCHCAKCRGKVWVVYQYDLDAGDVRVVTPAALALHGSLYLAWQNSSSVDEHTWIEPGCLHPL